MATPPGRWVGYALLTAGSSLLFDTYTFLQADWSPLHVPMPAPTELSFGYLLAICGVAVLFWRKLILLIEDIAPDASMKFGQGLANQSVEWRRQQRLPLKTRIATLPNRGLVGGSAVLFLLIPMYLMLQKPDSQGIYVGINERSGRTRDDYCLAGPIVVSVRKNGASTQLLLNGSEIKRQKLAWALRAQLAARANWEVFVEGDDSVSYADAIEVIEQITALHARSVMLTPQLKRELAQECPSR